MLPSFYQPIEELIGEDAPSNSTPSIDHNADELPFSALGGRRFEILGYLLEIDDAQEIETVTVTLVQSSADKGRDILVHQNGTLVRIIQCKNLLKKVGRSDLLQELIKLLLNNEVESFLPGSSVLYELWAPRGFTESADTLVAEWPNKLDDADVLSAFQKVTSTYKTLEHFRWETTGQKLLVRLKGQFRLKRQDGITISRRVRSNLSVYQQFFQAVIVMQVEDVEYYMDHKLLPKLAQIVRMTAETELDDPASLIDREIDQAVTYINSRRFQDAESQLRRLEEHHCQGFNHRHEYRIKANRGVAAFGLGHAKEAANYFLEAVVLEPEDERALTNEVFAHFLLGNDDKAFELSNERRTRYPDSGRILAIWISTAPPAVSVDELEKAVSEQLRNDPEVNAALCRKLLLAGRILDARACAARTQEKAPDWPQGFLLSAQCSMAFTLMPPEVQQTTKLQRRSVIDEGIIAASKARELGESHSDIDAQAQSLAMRCELYLLTGDVEAASADAKQACRMVPTDVGNLLALAQTQLVQDKVEMGIDTLEEALGIQDRPDVALMLSRALRSRNATGDRKRALDLLEKQNLAALPEVMRPPIVIDVVQLLALEKEWSRASRYLELVRETLDVVTWQALSAWVLKGDNHPQDAEGRASEALRNLAPSTHLSTREFLARVLMQMGRLNDALPIYEELFAYDIPIFDPMQLIECAGRLNRDQVVLDTFDELHRRTAVDWHLLEIDVFYLRKYHAAKAIDRLSAFLDKHPDHKLARLSRSAIAWELGRNELLTSRLDDLPGVDEMPISYIRIALKLISLGENADQVIDYAYRFLKLHFDKAEAHSALIFSVLSLRKDVDKNPNLPKVIEGAAIGYRELPDGPLKWTVLEKTNAPDQNFEERSVDDAISQDLLGKSVGDKFVLVPGRVDRLGEIVQILPKFVRRFQDSMTEMPVRFPSEAPNFQSVRIGGPDELDPGIAAVLASVRERAEQVKSLQDLYLSQPIPVHLYAKRLGKNAYEGIMHLAETESVSVKCSHPDPVAFASAVSSLETTKSIVLDLSAVATIRLLDIDDLLSSHEFVLSQDSAFELRETLIDDEPERQGGTMVYNDKDGRYSLYEEPSEQRRDRIKRDKEFCEAILAKTKIKPHLGLASIEETQRETLIKFLDEYGTEAVIVAMEPDTVLWTDDLTQGDLATSMFGVRRVWSLAFLEFCLRRGLLSTERYTETVAKLVGMRYQVTPFNNVVLVQAAKLAKYQPSAWPFAQAVEAFSIPNAMVDQLLRIILLFFIQLSEESVVSQGVGGLVTALLEALWQNPQARLPLLALRKNSARVFGLNVVAESNFNSIFDNWSRKHSKDIL
jgi:tetratricopeptide (TPR) repeat protein